MRDSGAVAGTIVRAELACAMPRVCSICSHSERSAIDSGLVAGTPYRDIAGQFGVSKSALERHAGTHLLAGVARSAQLMARVDADQLIAELRVLREVTLGVLEEARQAEQHAIALQAIARLEKQAELVGRLAGELVERHRVETVAVLFSQEWQQLRPAIVRALQPFPEAAFALEAALRGIDAAE